MSDLMVTTMNDLPGYRITNVYGEVFGLTVRSRTSAAHRSAVEGARRR